MKQLQSVRGYLTPGDIMVLAEEFSMTTTQLYETASFYQMLRFRPTARYVIQICRSAPCHVAGAASVIESLEHVLGISMGETTEDGQYMLEFTECIGQCQGGPSLLVNGTPYTGVTAEKVEEFLQEIGRGDK